MKHDGESIPVSEDDPLRVRYGTHYAQTYYWKLVIKLRDDCVYDCGHIRTEFLIFLLI